jgi:hypothetical protein
MEAPSHGASGAMMDNEGGPPTGLTPLDIEGDQGSVPKAEHTPGLSSTSGGRRALLPI